MKNTVIYQSNEGNHLRSKADQIIPRYQKIIDLVQDRYHVEIQNIDQFRNLLQNGFNYIKTRIQDELPIMAGFKQRVEQLELPDYDDIQQLINYERRVSDYQLFQILNIDKGIVVVDNEKVKKMNESDSVFCRSKKEEEAFKALKRIEEDLNTLRKGWYFTSVKDLDRLFIENEDGDIIIREYWFKEQKHS